MVCPVEELFLHARMIDGERGYTGGRQKYIQFLLPRLPALAGLPSNGAAHHDAMAFCANNSKGLAIASSFSMSAISTARISISAICGGLATSSSTGFSAARN